MDKWTEYTQEEMKKPYCKELTEFVNKEYAEHTCYPPYDQIMNAFNTTPYENVKCVILGQDPYHGVGQAMGLSFSVNKGVKIPRSLQNMYTELKDELGCYIPNNGDLTKWAKQGVLMLNAVLTVQAHSPASHANKGWERYTDGIISLLNQKTEPIVFMLWGKFAQGKAELITNKHHLILMTSHPSPYSADRGFLGCGHFKKCNEFLIRNHIEPIDWQIENV